MGISGLPTVTNAFTMNIPIVITLNLIIMVIILQPFIEHVHNLRRNKEESL